MKKIFKFLVILLVVLGAALFVGNKTIDNFDYFPIFGLNAGLLLKLVFSLDLVLVLIIGAGFVLIKAFYFFPLVAGACILIVNFAPTEIAQIVAPFSLIIGVIYYLIFVQKN